MMSKECSGIGVAQIALRVDKTAMRYPGMLVVGILAVRGALCAAESWTPLFNGKDLEGWRTWLAKPHESVAVPSEPRDDSGHYLKPLGWDRDPLGVFTVAEIDGQAAIHVSGQIMGCLETKSTYGDYHLRLQFKWGEKRWAPRAQTPRDSGLLYHVHSEPGFSSGIWPRSIEFQIQEHDCGDLYAIGLQITVLAKLREQLPPIYDPQGEPILFRQVKPIGNRCVRLGDFEKPCGEWNTLDLICLGDESIHVVNGHIVMRLAKAQRIDGANPEPLKSGNILLQSEGAEVFYRNVELRPIKTIPLEYAEKS